MNKPVKSCIEILPDELWLQVFTYNSVFDLYYAWRNLNSHINAILHSVPIGIYIKNNRDDNICSKEILTYFSSQIVHIKDERFNTTFMQAWPIDFHSLVNFRSLYLAQCSQEQFNQLLNFHQLTRLSLPCGFAENFLERFVVGKDREERFPQLRSIGRIWSNSRTSYRNLPSYSINRRIQHVHLVMRTKDSTADFLEYLPELSLITVDYLAQENTSFSSCFIMAKIRRQHHDRLSNALSKIALSSQTTNQNNSWLITVAESIHRLEIDFNGKCDFEKLAGILDKCPILEKVRIRVKYYPQNIDLTSLRQISPFFTGLTYGNILKETGKPMLIAKWPL